MVRPCRAARFGRQAAFVTLAVAGTLLDAIGAALITVSRNAFVEAFETTALACAGTA